MKPLQVWLPYLRSASHAQARRDRERAIDAWRCEETVWLVPEIHEPFRWKENPFKKFVAVPSEGIDRIDVYHVGTKGVVYGLAAQWRFRKGRIDGLLDDWLNCTRTTSHTAPSSVTFVEFPQLKGDHVVYTRRELQVGPVGAAPIKLANEGTFSSRWPPKGQNYKTVSPDAESAEASGPLDPLVESGLTMGVSRRDGEKTLWLVNRWPEYIQRLVAGADGLDLILAHAQMCSIAKQSEEDAVQARLMASTLAAPHVFQGHTSQALSWLWPLYAEGEESVLFEAETLGVSGRSLNELRQNPRFRELMREQVPIRRAWGATGLFWALLLERLEEGEGFRVCQRCSRILSGRKDKRFCGLAENPECFAQRRAADQRRSRRKSTRIKSKPS